MRQSPLERSRFRGWYLLLLGALAAVFFFVALKDVVSVEGSSARGFFILVFGVVAGAAFIVLLAPYQRRWREGTDGESSSSSRAWPWLLGGLIGASAVVLDAGGVFLRVTVFSFIAGMIAAAPFVLLSLYRSDS